MQHLKIKQYLETKWFKIP